MKNENIISKGIFRTVRIFRYKHQSDLERLNDMRINACSTGALIIQTKGYRQVRQVTVYAGK